MQVGYGRGNVGGSISVGVQPYVEWNAPSDYHAAWLSAPSLETNNRFGVWYAGYNTAGGTPVFNAWIKTSSANSVVGTTPIPHYLNRADANYESYAIGGTCPTPTSVANSGVYYGTSGSGSYGSTWAFYKMNSNGQWNEWAQTPTTYQNSPYTYGNIHQWSAWKVASS
jgi:hypothetical protein